MDDLETLMPPNWRKEVRDGLEFFVNDISGEEAMEHPYHQFLRKFTQTPLAPTNNGAPSTSMRTPSRQFSSDSNGAETTMSRPASVGFVVQDTEEGTLKPSSPTLNDFFGTRTEVNFPDLSNLKEINYDYHCQWTERDINGDVSMYGLTIRYQRNGTTMIKFDGIDATWTYTALKGPYGCLEMHDLFIGAKITLFGRHLTISAANSAACKWIAKEKKRLEKQQEAFRKKIESIGEIPCVKRKESSNVKDITRVGKLDEHTNLRLVLKENARLGEQLAKLGLAQRLG